MKNGFINVIAVRIASLECKRKTQKRRPQRYAGAKKKTEFNERRHPATGSIYYHSYTVFSAVGCLAATCGVFFFRFSSMYEHRTFATIPSITRAECHLWTSVYFFFLLIFCCLWCSCSAQSDVVQSQRQLKHSVRILSMFISSLNSPHSLFLRFHFIGITANGKYFFFFFFFHFYSWLNLHSLKQLLFTMSIPPARHSFENRN